MVSPTENSRMTDTDRSCFFIRVPPVKVSFLYYIIPQRILRLIFVWV